MTTPPNSPIETTKIQELLNLQNLTLTVSNDRLAASTFLLSFIDLGLKYYTFSIMSQRDYKDILTFLLEQGVEATNKLFNSKTFDIDYSQFLCEEDTKEIKQALAEVNITSEEFKSIHKKVFELTLLAYLKGYLKANQKNHDTETTI